jgi:hypothetical protein
MEELLFKIETGLKPKHTPRGQTVRTRAVCEKITMAINNMRDGQSMVFDGISKQTFRDHMKTHFPEIVYKVQLIDEVKKWHRFFIISKNSKP